ncbi:uncharacterized protein LOC100902838 [Galendromus occidentalis]|uniref:Uncharacterized protein LOC100902838 n=1 Tax=Galendromus occidentalis TaxID=34638 RepID=A0AAJ6VXN2_9ACAR|nr:uncharacterized protein LOC100902838 [Galendromus occidentalis]
MVEEGFLKNLLGAALVSAGGEVPLNHVQQILRKNFDIELPSVENHVALEKYLVTRFADICRVKRAADGHFVVRVLRLPSISHLLPSGYDEPEFEPLGMAESEPLKFEGAPAPLRNGTKVQPSRVSTVIPPNPPEHRNKKEPRAGEVRSPLPASLAKQARRFETAVYQDEADAAALLPNLENQLAEECFVRHLIEPTFQTTNSGAAFREVFCVATWGNEKIQSHPGFFCTEAGAKTNVIKKILTGIDALAPKVLQCQSSMSPGDVDSTPGFEGPKPNFGEVSEEISLSTKTNLTGQESRPIEQEFRSDSSQPGGFAVSVENRNGTQDGVTFFSGESASSDLPEESGQRASVALDDIFEEPDQSVGNKSQVALPSSEPSSELVPQIDMDQPSTHGYLSCVLEDRSLMVQVKGPGLEKWERQTYAFNPKSPTTEIVPFRWYVVHIAEGDDVRFYDRAMCVSEDGPQYDDRGFVYINFPDNGYSEYVDPSMVFDLKNYDEIDRLPAQALQIHAVGLTGRTPIEELSVAHPPHHDVLFLPAHRSQCFMSSCNLDVPHVYIYDTVTKRVLC